MPKQMLLVFVELESWLEGDKSNRGEYMVDRRIGGLLFGRSNSGISSTVVSMDDRKIRNPFELFI